MREFASFESRNGRSGLKDQGEGGRRKERGAQKGAGGRGERAKVCWGETGLSWSGWTRPPAMEEGWAGWQAGGSKRSEAG